MVSGIIHMFVSAHLVAHMMVLLSCVILHALSEKCTWHPALHSVGTDISECDAKSGMMWARRAWSGSIGRSSRHVCVLRTDVPSGSVMDIGAFVFIFCSISALVVR